MSKHISILVVIDTDGIRKHYPQPSTNSAKPTAIGHQYGFMIASGTAINSGQGTGDLSIKALVGDQVRAFATSGSDNFEDAVLLYGMPMFSGQQVFSDFTYQNYTKSTVVPQSKTSPLPANSMEEVFWFFKADVIAKGTENYLVQFGLYTRDPDTGNPVLFGYFSWDPQVTVAG